MTNSSPVILIAEDEKDLLELYTESLEMFGMKVYGALDGATAWAKFNDLDGKVDLVISDIFMPKMNGVQLMTHIKEHDASIPVFLITGYAHLHTLVEECNYEPDEYLEKPFNLPILLEKINSLINS